MKAHCAVAKEISVLLINSGLWIAVVTRINVTNEFGRLDGSHRFES
jgi:hypothetical protein